MPNTRLIAFYLPQFHPIPENDAWWGTGFTEWTNVSRATPLFRGHYQPRLPADLGYYDLRVPETRAAQAELASAHGIGGFCYWHYWFDGKRLLERPFNEVLTSGEPEFPFCLAWANQSWTGIWHGAPDRILIEQTYPGEADFKAHFYTVLDAFTDHRYMTVDGKPIFVIYDPINLPNPRSFTDSWRHQASKAGLKGLYFVGVANPMWDPVAHGFDASTPHYPSMLFNYLETVPRSPWYWLKKKFRRGPRGLMLEYGTDPSVYHYSEAIRYGVKQVRDGCTQFPCVIPGWDNTARCGRDGRVLQDATPDLFRKHLREAVDMVADRPADTRIIFVKSWNEWAEGNYLEPDQRYGNAFLDVVHDVMH